MGVHHFISLKLDGSWLLWRDFQWPYPWLCRADLAEETIFLKIDIMLGYHQIPVWMMTSSVCCLSFHASFGYGIQGFVLYFCLCLWHPLYILITNSSWTMKSVHGWSLHLLWMLPWTILDWSSTLKIVCSTFICNISLNIRFQKTEQFTRPLKSRKL